MEVDQDQLVETLFKIFSDDELHRLGGIAMRSAYFRSIIHQIRHLRGIMLLHCQIAGQANLLDLGRTAIKAAFEISGQNLAKLENDCINYMFLLHFLFPPPQGALSLVTPIHASLRAQSVAIVEGLPPFPTGMQGSIQTDHASTTFGQTGGQFGNGGLNDIFAGGLTSSLRGGGENVVGGSSFGGKSNVGFVP